MAGRVAGRPGGQFRQIILPLRGSILLILADIVHSLKLEKSHKTMFMNVGKSLKIRKIKQK